jgi:hypothetical protein
VFQRNIPRSSSETSVKQSSDCHLLHAGFLFGLLLDPEDGDDVLLQNVVLLLVELHGVVSQKIGHFITIALKTKIPTKKKTPWF